MAYSSYATEDQYIFPENVSILTPSPLPAPQTEQPDSFQRMPKYIPPLLSEYIENLLQPVFEKYEADKRRKHYIKTTGYYIAYFLMIIIGFVYIYSFIQIFSKKD